MLLLHLHCILLHQLYTCPVLFVLMLLHTFLILPVIVGCTGWYSFLPALSIVFHIVSVYIPARYTACYMAGCEASDWSCVPYLFLCGYFGCLPQPHSGYLLFCSILRSIWSLCADNPSLHSAFSCKVSGYVSMILDILFLFPIAVHTIQTALWRSLYENIFPKILSSQDKSPAISRIITGYQIMQSQINR